LFADKRAIVRGAKQANRRDNLMTDQTNQANQQPLNISSFRFEAAMHRIADERGEIIGKIWVVGSFAAAETVLKTYPSTSALCIDIPRAALCTNLAEAQAFYKNDQ
jgi:hypothetical protein